MYFDYHPDPLIFDVWHDQRRYVKFIAQGVWASSPSSTGWYWTRSSSRSRSGGERRRGPGDPYRASILPLHGSPMFLAREEETHQFASLVAVYRG